MLTANNDKAANAALSTPIFGMPAPTTTSATTSTTASSKAYYRMDSHERRGVDTQPLQHIWIITGPAGSGKTTVAQKLHVELGLPYLEGDDFHPEANKEKMGNGIPLNDMDRWDWLISLRDAAINILSNPSSSTSSSSSSSSSSSLPSSSSSSPDTAAQVPSGVIMSCSALKLKYRDVLRVAAYDHPSVRLHFIYLKANENKLLERVMGRSSHYMKENMVRSQFEALEDPCDEKDVLVVDVDAPPDEVQRRVSETVARKLAEYN